MGRAHHRERPHCPSLKSALPLRRLLGLLCGARFAMSHLQELRLLAPRGCVRRDGIYFTTRGSGVNIAGSFEANFLLAKTQLRAATSSPLATHWRRACATSQRTSLVSPTATQTCTASLRQPMTSGAATYPFSLKTNP